MNHSFQNISWYLTVGGTPIKTFSAGSPVCGTLSIVGGLIVLGVFHTPACTVFPLLRCLRNIKKIRCNNLTYFENVRNNFSHHGSDIAGSTLLLLADIIVGSRKTRLQLKIVSVGPELSPVYEFCCICP